MAKMIKFDGLVQALSCAVNNITEGAGWSNSARPDLCGRVSVMGRSTTTVKRRWLWKNNKSATIEYGLILLP